MEYKVGDKVQGRINKVQDNGCYCTLYHSQQFGFMPNYLMPNYTDESGRCIKKVNEIVDAYTTSMPKDIFCFQTNVCLKRNLRNSDPER